MHPGERLSILVSSFFFCCQYFLINKSLLKYLQPRCYQKFLALTFKNDIPGTTIAKPKSQCPYACHKAILLCNSKYIFGTAFFKNTFPTELLWDKDLVHFNYKEQKPFHSASFFQKQQTQHEPYPVAEHPAQNIQRFPVLICQSIDDLHTCIRLLFQY